ncbi:co-chaperone GroES [Candidatus Dojkabacteria bacterium]|uniref:Co-chaperonin GroES n=1 Tax=Candidatus Dojkabacteria bacterium TaxID=2099670 RepID=A0A3M0Z0Q4_9BACT|nr:MAG: co-chaperone GroES [Candidatus Dojkabacteria bacterium]
MSDVKHNKIKPVGEYILVKPSKEEESTPSGLILQSSSKSERPQKGEIIALGAGKLNEKGERVPFSVEVGQMVLFKKYSPEEVELDGETYLLMREQDILAILVNS